MKKCKICGKDFSPFNPVQNTCSISCENEKKKRKIELKNENKKIVDWLVKEKKPYFIPHKSATNTNTVREITPERQEEVYERDHYRCIYCGSRWPLDRPHHVFYWAEANRTETRNDANQLVTLCMICHRKLHFAPGGKEIRLFCINYVWELK